MSTNLSTLPCQWWCPTPPTGLAQTRLAACDMEQSHIFGLFVLLTHLHATWWNPCWTPNWKQRHSYCQDQVHPGTTWSPSTRFEEKRESPTWQESKTRTKPPWVPTAIKCVVAIQVGAPELTRSIAEQIWEETALRMTCLEVNHIQSRISNHTSKWKPHNAPKLLSCVWWPLTTLPRCVAPAAFASPRLNWQSISDVCIDSSSRYCQVGHIPVLKHEGLRQGWNWKGRPGITWGVEGSPLPVPVPVMLESESYSLNPDRSRYSVSLKKMEECFRLDNYSVLRPPQDLFQALSWFLPQSQDVWHDQVQQGILTPLLVLVIAPFPLRGGSQPFIHPDPETFNTMRIFTLESAICFAFFIFHIQSKLFHQRSLQCPGTGLHRYLSSAQLIWWIITHQISSPQFLFFHR